VAIVAAIVLLNSGGKDDPISTPPTPLANSGPFTGTFSVAFGPKVYGSGNPVANAPPATTETWRVRSECGDNGCVANASNDGKLAAKDLVFDKIGDSWLAVTTSTAPCKNIDAEAWNVISLEPQVDGTMTGEMTQSTTNACFNKRTVTFTRTGDADVGSLPDPATEPKRTPSPAEAFRGRYHNELVFSDGDKQEYDYDVKTACLRTGERCNSSFVDPTGDSADSMVFASGKWNRNIEYDATVCTTDGNRIILTGEFPLPQPTQDPIALLTGHTHQESTSPSCGDWEVEEKFIRSGD
jgi:serine/threonine-protein kinase